MLVSSMVPARLWRAEAATAYGAGAAP
jgi:hypothetical protein